VLAREGGRPGEEEVGERDMWKPLRSSGCPCFDSKDRGLDFAD
jgi:hypothetical protein